MPSSNFFPTSSDPTKISHTHSIYTIYTKGYLGRAWPTFRIQDLSTYEPIAFDYSKSLSISINRQLKRFLDKKMLSRFNYNRLRLVPDNIRSQRMYFLRKIHKTPHQIRPIVSCCSGPTEKISGFLAEKLAAFLQDIPSLLTNSTQLIRKLEQTRFLTDFLRRKTSGENITLVTMDVKALYSNIPQELGVNMVLDRIIPCLPPPPDQEDCTFKGMLRSMLLTVIKDNVFNFNDQTFRQVKGLAMEPN